MSDFKCVLRVLSSANCPSLGEKLDYLEKLINLKLIENEEASKGIITHVKIISGQNIKIKL
jgi:hypothetical protein